MSDTPSLAQITGACQVLARLRSCWEAAYASMCDSMETSMLFLDYGKEHKRFAKACNRLAESIKKLDTLSETFPFLEPLDDWLYDGWKCHNPDRYTDGLRHTIFELRKGPGFWQEVKDRRENHAATVRHTLDVLEAELERLLETAKRANKRKTDKDHARNKWLYEQRCKGTPDQEILDELNRIRKKKGWRGIGTVQGVRERADAYAVTEVKPKPPPRRGF
jgi:hypothetical protein